MNTKLTLTIEQEVIEKAKKYARAKERSLSDIIENYLKAITDDADQDDITIAPIVKSLRGSFSIQTDVDYKKELANRLVEKYL